MGRRRRRLTRIPLNAAKAVSPVRRVAPLLIFTILSVTGCNRTTPAPAQKSPDGTMTFSTSVNQSKANPTRYLCVVVDIIDASGRMLHHEVTPASDTQRWSIRWVGNDEILLDSSDVGHYHLRRQPAGTWTGELSAN